MACRSDVVWWPGGEATVHRGVRDGAGRVWVAFRRLDGGALPFGAWLAAADVLRLARRLGGCFVRFSGGGREERVFARCLRRVEVGHHG